MHWACSKISAASDIPDEQLLEILDAKLKAHSHIQFTNIASHAQSTGRLFLASQLLSYEKDPSKQVSPEWLNSVTEFSYWILLLGQLLPKIAHAWRWDPQIDPAGSP